MLSGVKFIKLIPCFNIIIIITPLRIIIVSIIIITIVSIIFAMSRITNIITNTFAYRARIIHMKFMFYIIHFLCYSLNISLCSILR